MPIQLINFIVRQWQTGLNMFLPWSYLQCICVCIVAVVAVSMLCGRGWGLEKECNIIAVLGFILGLFGTIKSAMYLSDDWYNIIPSYVSPVYGRDLTSLLRTILIVEVVTNSTYIIYHGLLFMGLG